MCKTFCTLYKDVFDFLENDEFLDSLNEVHYSYLQFILL